MEMTMSGTGKVVILAVILAIFAVVGWRMGAPDSFQAVLADAGVAQPPAPAAAAPATPAAPAPTLTPGAAPDSAPAQTPQQSPAPNSGDSSTGH